MFRHDIEIRFRTDTEDEYIAEDRAAIFLSYINQNILDANIKRIDKRKDCCDVYIELAMCKDSEDKIVNKDLMVEDIKYDINFGFLIYLVETPIKIENHETIN